MKVLRKIIQIDKEKCDGCGNCVPSCAEGAIEIVDGKAEVIADRYCDGLGACLGECPQGALKIVEREADEFDEEAVHALLEKKDPVPASCPGAGLQILSGTNCEQANLPNTHTGAGPSALGHWPVQIRLVPPDAPFLAGADLVIAADCVPVAYPSFHADFLAGKAIMIGCPKFDDKEGYVEKLTQVFARSGVKSVTSVSMEVPCCSALPMIIKKALEKSGTNVEFREVVISRKGERLS